MSSFKKFILIMLVIAFLFALLLQFNKKSNHPIVAIANYGPHSSLTDTITGLKQQLSEVGFIENKNIIYEIRDVNFDTALIPQMISQMKIKKPLAIVTLTTPVAQFTKSAVKDIPIIFSAITDPIEGGLIQTRNKSYQNITGASDQQSFDIMLKFAKELLPRATRVGVLYSTSEANDLALIRMLEIAALKLNMEVVAISIDQSRDIAMRMQGFAGKVDFIYVGSSGPIQPALPVIAAESNKMGIPVINLNEEAVKQNMVLASYGVDYIQVGKNTGIIVAQILNGERVANIPPIYPQISEHKGYISKKQADKFGIIIPFNLVNVTIEE